MTASLAEVLAGVAREHRLTVGRCTCDWTLPRNAPMLPTHEAHLAAEQSRAVAEWLRSPEVRGVAAAAVHADECGCEDWSPGDVDDPVYDQYAAAALDAVAGLCGPSRRLHHDRS